MLVLSRKENESIVIGNNISIVVVSIQGDKVKIGIDAPKDVVVDRKEVAISKQLEKERISGKPKNSEGNDARKGD